MGGGEHIFDGGVHAAAAAADDDDDDSPLILIYSTPHSAPPVLVMETACGACLGSQVSGPWLLGPGQPLYLPYDDHASTHSALSSTSHLPYDIHERHVTPTTATARYSCTPYIVYRPTKVCLVLLPTGMPVNPPRPRPPLSRRT